MLGASGPTSALGPISGAVNNSTLMMDHVMMLQTPNSEGTDDSNDEIQRYGGNRKLKRFICKTVGNACRFKFLFFFMLFEGGSGDFSPSSTVSQNTLLIKKVRQESVVEGFICVFISSKNGSLNVPFIRSLDTQILKFAVYFTCP